MIERECRGVTPHHPDGMMAWCRAKGCLLPQLTGLPEARCPERTTPWVRAPLGDFR